MTTITLVTVVSISTILLYVGMARLVLSLEDEVRDLQGEIQKLRHRLPIKFD